MVDPDPQNVSTKYKEHQTASEDNIQLLLMHRNQTTLSDGWSGDIKQMPFSICAHFSTVSAITALEKMILPTT